VDDGAHRELAVLSARHGHVGLRIDVDNLAVVIAAPMEINGFGDEAFATEFDVRVGALAIAASLPTLRAPRGLADPTALSRGSVQGSVVGADDGHLRVAVDVVPFDVGVVVAAIVQLRCEVNELGGSFFTGDGAVIQGSSRSWCPAPLCSDPSAGCPVGVSLRPTLPVGRSEYP
jgi:hypothetical protein